MEYGLIGEKLSHSFSKEIHTKYFGINYCLKELKPNEVAGFLENRSFFGINVTIPYKQTVMEHLDFVSEIAQKIGAVNTIVNNNGKLEGYNTDFSGLKNAILKSGIAIKDKQVLILGGGATSKTAFAVAEEFGASSIIRVSRKGSAETISYSQAKDMTETQVIINTTPVGMYPEINKSLINIADYPRLEGVFDAIYNPLSSRLVTDAKRHGITACGGLYMLVSQAVFSAQLFKNTDIYISKVDSIYKEILNSKENIVLVGMPCSGKTTVGKLLAEKIGRDFIDIDDEIVKSYGKIEDIFKTKGESGFRDIESEVVKRISALQGKVIATGGGAVLRNENIDLLKQNGRIYFIDRPLEKLEVNYNRPLLKSKQELKKLYKERYNIYCGCCDKRIISNTTPEDTAINIKEDFYNEDINN